MKQLLTAMLILISLTVFSQQKPVPKETAPKDTVQKAYVLIGKSEDSSFLLTVLIQSKLQYRGEQLSYAQINDLVAWIQQVKAIEPPKQQDKTK